MWAEQRLAREEDRSHGAGDASVEKVAEGINGYIEKKGDNSALSFIVRITAAYGLKYPGGVLNRNLGRGFGRLNETLTLFKTQKM